MTEKGTDKPMIKMHPNSATTFSGGESPGHQMQNAHDPEKPRIRSKSRRFSIGRLKRRRRNGFAVSLQEAGITLPAAETVAFSPPEGREVERMSSLRVPRPFVGNGRGKIGNKLGRSHSGPHGGESRTLLGRWHIPNVGSESVMGLWAPPPKRQLVGPCWLLWYSYLRLPSLHLLTVTPPPPPLLNGGVWPPSVVRRPDRAGEYRPPGGGHRNCWHGSGIVVTRADSCQREGRRAGPPYDIIFIFTEFIYFLKISFQNLSS